MCSWSRKVVSLVIVFLMASGLMAGCSGGQTGGAGAASSETLQNADGTKQASADAGTPKGEKLKCRYTAPGTAPTQMDIMTEAINKELEKDGLNLEFAPNFIAWDAWAQKTNMMLSSGEEFELLHVMQDQIPLATYAGRGALTPLNELIDKYASGVKPMFEKDVWNSFTIKGNIMSIPAQWIMDTQTGFTHGPLGIRLDMLKKNGLEYPKTVDELISTLETVQKNWGGSKKPYCWEQNSHNAPVWLHRTYDTWPFFVDNNGLFYVDQQGNTKSFIETEEFKKNCETYRKLYTKGLIHPDVLSVPPETYSKEMDEGNCLLGFGTFDLRLDTKLKEKIKDLEMAQFFLYPERPILQDSATGNSNAVPATTKHPEAGVMFINWLYTDTQNLYLFCYGLEGQHYKSVGTDRIEVMKDAKGEPLYEWPFWQIAYYKYVKFSVTENAEHIRLITEPATNTVVSPVMGFSFDSEPVKVEYANVMAEYDNSILPLKMGVVDYDANFKAALARMKAAGIDKVVEEFSRQLKDFLASK